MLWQPTSTGWKEATTLRSAKPVIADAGLIAARFLSIGTLLFAAGLPLYLLTGRGYGLTLTRPSRTVVAGCALAAALLSLWWAMEAVAAMAALPVTDLDRTTIMAVLQATGLADMLALRLAALGALAAALFVAPAAVRLPLAVLFGAVALVTLSWTGHAGATEGVSGIWHRLSNSIHLLAAALWLGALAQLLTGILHRYRGGLRDSGLRDSAAMTLELSLFARSGSVIVLLLLVTGIINLLLIAGWPLPEGAIGSLWSLVLAVKLLLFAAMLGLAALNRWWLTPALEKGADPARGRAALRLSLSAEMTAGVTVVLAVAILGTLNPSS